MLEISALSTRDQIPQLLNQMGLCGWGVEIGVHLGEYSERLLAGSKLDKLFSVDPWHPKYEGIPESNHESYFQQTTKRLWKYFPRSVILRQSSWDASAFFQPNSMCLVYIDGQHSYEAVSGDIALWRNKVKPGGILAGHDYDEISPGVMKAVDEFVFREKLTLHKTICDFVHQGTPISSWLVEVPNV